MIPEAQLHEGPKSLSPFMQPNGVNQQPLDVAAAMHIVLLTG